MLNHDAEDDKVGPPGTLSQFLANAQKKPSTVKSTKVNKYAREPPRVNDIRDKDT